MSLQNTQAEFSEMIFSENEHNDTSMPANIVIYRNNMLSCLLRAMMDIYPMIVKLVGEDFFRITAKEYIRCYPSQSGNLYDYGEYFSDFLSEYPKVKSLNYLAEVAQFEWYYHILHFAGDYSSFNIQSLAALSPDEYQNLHFILHPACRLHHFHYPILRIIDLCNNKIAGDLNINEGGNYLLMQRPLLDIELVQISQADFTFLTALRDNFSLSSALEMTMQIEPEFKLQEKLLKWIDDKIIVDYL